MKHITKLGLLLILLIVISGCTSSQSSLLSQQEFRNGIREAELTLLENAPPQDVFPNSNFKIIVNVRNNAAYNLRNGLLKLVGLTQEYFMIDQAEQMVPELEGRGITNPSGDQEFIEFSLSSGELLPSAQSRSEQYLVKFQYESSVEFSDTICINPNLYDIYASGCKVEPSKTYSGQGAPLVISSMEEVISPGQDPFVEIRLTLKNRGRGEVEKIHLNAVRLGGKDLNCQFADETGSDLKDITLSKNNQETLLKCSTILETQNAYATSLFASFTYDYSVSLNKRINLVNSAFRK